MFDSDFDPRERGRFAGQMDPSGFGHEPDGSGPEDFGPGAGVQGGRRRRRRPHGPGRGGSHGFGGPHGRGPGRPGRGRRARRGDIRQAILLLLDEESRNGYGLMQEVEDRSGGAWRPSPGSVYPALSQLEDEGLVEMNETEGRKDFSLTDEGRKWVEENRDQIGSPWDAEGRGAPIRAPDGARKCPSGPPDVPPAAIPILRCTSHSEASAPRDKGSRRVGPGR